MLVQESRNLVIGPLCVYFYVHLKNNFFFSLCLSFWPLLSYMKYRNKNAYPDYLWVPTFIIQESKQPSPKKQCPQIDENY